MGITLCTSCETSTSWVKTPETTDFEAKATTPTVTPTANPICRILSRTERASFRLSCNIACYVKLSIQQDCHCKCNKCQPVHYTHYSVGCCSQGRLFDAAASFTCTQCMCSDNTAWARQVISQCNLQGYKWT